MPTLTAPTEAQLLRDAIAYAQCRGCVVRRPEIRTEWLTPAEIRQRTGLKGPALTKRLRAKGCPPFECERGRKRILRILAHERLMAFLTLPAHPGAKLRL